MKKMLVLAMTMAMVLLAAAGVCETLRVGMECNYAPYNWTQSDASENAVAIAAGGYADGYDVRIAKIIADKLGMDLEIVKTEWDGLTPALLSGNIDVIIAGMSPTAERRMTIDFTDSYYDTELTVVVRKDSAFASAKSLADLAGAKITGQMSTFHYDMIDQIEAYGPDFLGVEDGQIWKALRSQFETRCIERQVFQAFEVLQPLTDKIVRASPLKGRMQLKKVFIWKDKPWTDVFVRELMVFPGGKNDDQVDAAAWCARLTMNHMPKKPPAPKKLESWRDKLRGLSKDEGASHMAA